MPQIPDVNNRTQRPVPHGRSRLRSALRLAAFTLAGTVALLVLLLLLLQLSFVATPVARLLLTAANPWQGTTATIGSVRGTWVHDLKLRDVRISAPDSSMMVTIDSLELSYDLTALLDGELHFQEIRLIRPRLMTGTTPEGEMEFLRPFGGPSGAEVDSSAGLKLWAGSISVESGAVALRSNGESSAPTLEVSDILLRAQRISLGRHVTLVLDTLSAVYGSGPDSLESVHLELSGAMAEDLITVRTLQARSPHSKVRGSGTIALPLDTIFAAQSSSFNLHADPIAYRDLAPLLSDLGPEGEASLTLEITRDTRRASATLSGQLEGGGNVGLSATAEGGGTGAPQIRAEVIASRVNIPSLSGRSDTTQQIDLRATLAGRGIEPDSFVGRLTSVLDARGLVGSRTLRASISADIDDGTAEIAGKGNLDELVFSIAGRLLPFSRPPVYDLTTTAEISSAQASAGPDDFLEKLKGLNAKIRMHGTGFDPLSGTSNLTARAFWKGNPFAESLVLEASSSDSVVKAKGHLTTHHGSVQLDAHARFGSSPEFVLEELDLRRFDLSAVLGLRKSVVLTGSASGSLGGPSLEEGTGSLSLRLDSSRAGTTRIHRVRCDASLRRGLLELTLNGASSDGDLSLRASAEPFAAHPSVAMSEASFERLDLGGLLFDGDGATELNGTAHAQAVFLRQSDVQPGAESAIVSSLQKIVGTMQVELARSRLYRQEILGSTMKGELTGEAGSFEFSLRTPDGGIFLSGSVDSLRSVPQGRLTRGRLEHLDLGALAGVDSLDTDISGTLTGEIRGRSRETAGGSVDLELDPSHINSEPIHEAKLVADLRADRVSLDADAVLGAGSIALTGSGEFHEDLLSLKASGKVALHDLSRLMRDRSFTDTDVHVSFVTQGVLGEPGATHFASDIRARGRLGTFRLDSLISTLAISGRTVTVDSLLVHSNVGTVRAGGIVALFDTTGQSTSTFTLEASLDSLQHLGGVAGVQFPGETTAHLRAALTGTGKDGTLEGTADVASLEAGVVLIPALTARGQAHLGMGQHIRSVSVEVGAGGLAIGEVVTDTLVAAVTTRDSLAQFRASLSLGAGEFVAVRGSGLQLADRYAVTLDSLAVDLGNRLWTLDDPARIEVGEGLSIDDFSLSSGFRKITAHGRLDPAGEQDLRLWVDSLSLDRLTRFLGRPNLGGSLSMSAAVTGPAQHPKATGTLSARLVSHDKPVGTLRSDAEWAEGVLKITSTVTQPAGSQLSALVSLPASMPFVSRGAHAAGSTDTLIEGGTELTVQTSNFDLGFLEPFFSSRTLEQPQGLLSADLKLRASSNAVSGEGYLRIDSASVQVPSIGVNYAGGRMRVSLEGSDLVLDTLTVRTGEGGLSASGVVSLASREDPEFDLMARASRFVGINTQAMRAVADGSVSVSGTVSRPVITGDITIYDASLMIPEYGGEGRVEKVELTDADYATLRERFGYRGRPPGPSAPRDTTRVTLDVALHFPQNSWIRKRINPTLEVEIEGDLRIRSMPGEPLNLVGVLKPVPGRSYVSQFGRQFEIKSGEIRFNGPPSGFTMNVASEYKVPARSGSGLSEATIRMQVERAQERFSFHLSSDPPMEQADILSYLATGRASTGAFAAASSQGNLATSAALEQVVGVIGSLTEGKVPLDIFQVRPDGARGITIVAGNYVTPKTYLGVRYPIQLQETTQESYYDAGTEFEVEYQSFPWLFWNAKGGSTRLILLLKARHAY